MIFVSDLYLCNLSLFESFLLFDALCSAAVHCSALSVASYCPVLWTISVDVLPAYRGCNLYSHPLLLYHLLVQWLVLGPVYLQGNLVLLFYAVLPIAPPWLLFHPAGRIMRPFCPVPSALVATHTMCATALQSDLPMQMPRSGASVSTAASSIPQDKSCAATGRATAVSSITMPDTNALSVDHRVMVLSSVLASRRLNAHTPYSYVAWDLALRAHNLSSKYPSLVSSLRFGFYAAVPKINFSFTPSNSPSLYSNYESFLEIVHNEFRCGHYVGPFSAQQLVSIIGPFQTSPLSLVPKISSNKFCLVQNLSYPYSSNFILSSPSSFQTSINSAIDSDIFPCTWGTFTAISLLLSSLPPGSELASRDVMEAYRTIPLALDQWPGTVVCLAEDDKFAVNTCNCFGLSSAGGVWGMLADALCDIFWGAGVGPVFKWVDDFSFTRILQQFLAQYNARRTLWAEQIRNNGGRLQSHSQFWFRGNVLPDGTSNEFVEDCTCPLRDLSTTSTCSDHDGLFAYADCDIDHISQSVQVPWALDKSFAFAIQQLYIGFYWNLQCHVVGIPAEKKAKYISAIDTFCEHSTHTQENVQKLYGKLMHAVNIIPYGRAYLTDLEVMLGLYHGCSFRPIHAPKNTYADWSWWRSYLSHAVIECPLIEINEVFDIGAFSDASSAVGVGIFIQSSGPHWYAWCLQEGWNKQGRDIAWAEAIGFELLIRIILPSVPPGTHVIVYGDNTSVIDAWRNFRSRSRQVNIVFKRIIALLDPLQVYVHAHYVPSAENPADGPSRGFFPVAQKINVPPLPPELQPFLRPLTNASQVDQSKVLPKVPQAQLSCDYNQQFSDAADQLLEYEEFWHWD